MLDSIQSAKNMLNRDDIRPNTKVRLEEDIEVLRQDVKELYIELFKIIKN